MTKNNTHSKKSKNYRQMSDDLGDILNWFEQENIDIDKALEKYETAIRLIDDMEAHLKVAENKIKKISAKED